MASFEKRKKREKEEEERIKKRAQQRGILTTKEKERKVEREAAERERKITQMEKERVAAKPAPERPVAGAEAITKVGEKLKAVPGFKLAGKLATKALDVTGLITPEQAQQTRDWWGGRITVGNVIGAGVGIATVASGVSLLSAAAPNMARTIGVSALRGAGKKAAVTGGKGFMTRTVSAHQLMSTKYGGTKMIPRGVQRTFKAFDVSPNQASSLAARMAAMDRFQLRNVMKNGFALAKKAPKTIAAHQAGTILTSWFAADNLLTLTSMNTRDMAAQVRFGNISAEEALAELDAGQSDINSARWGVRLGAVTNPLLYPLWALMETAANSTNRNIERQRQIIEGMLI